MIALPLAKIVAVTWADLAGGPLPGFIAFSLGNLAAGLALAIVVGISMGMVLGWYPPTSGAYRPQEEYRRRAILHNHGLPPRDSLLIIADSFELAAEDMMEPEEYARMKFREVAAVEEVVRRYPEDPMAWYVLGEWRMWSGHEPWPLAGPPAVSLETFARAITLDPGFGPAYEHMPALYLALGRPDEARRSAATYLALDSTSPSASTRASPPPSSSVSLPHWPNPSPSPPAPRATLA